MILACTIHQDYGCSFDTTLNTTLHILLKVLVPCALYFFTY
jgi:hypothetical protein